jgi:DNA-binding PadR family transcriptional regulator
MVADPVQYALLGLISSRSDGIHGYQLKVEFDALCGDFWVLNYGHLYRTLDRLEKAGLIAGSELAQSGRPNRKIYRITASGRKSLDDWLLLPPADPRPLRDELALKLLFLSPIRAGETLALIRSQRAAYLKHLSRVSKRRVQLDGSDQDLFVTNLLLLQADMRVRADLAWLDLVERAVAERVARS